MPGGGAKAAGRQRCRRADHRHGGHERQKRLDALADDERRIAGGDAEAHGEAVDAAECVARDGDARL